MKRISIQQQLKLDYPGVNVSFDEERNHLIMDDKKLSLLINKEEFEHINTNSKSGKNYYQAIAQLIHTRYQLVPKPGSMADELIKTREEYNKFRVQNLSRDYGIGFLEDGEEVIAVKITGDMEKPLTIEEGEHLSRNQISNPEDTFGYLIEIKDGKG